MARITAPRVGQRIKATLRSGRISEGVVTSVDDDEGPWTEVTINDGDTLFVSHAEDFDEDPSASNWDVVSWEDLDRVLIERTIDEVLAALDPFHFTDPKGWTTPRGTISALRESLIKKIQEA